MSGLAAWWLWVAVAAAGALHGLHPASGWPLLAACATRDRRQVLRGLPLLALGHLAAMACVAAAVPLRVPGGPWMCAVLLLVLVAAGGMGWGLRGGRALPAGRAQAVGLVLVGCSLAMLEGTGLVLVPALGAICGRNGAVAAPLVSVLAAAVLHLAAMLASGALVAVVVAQGWRGRAAWRAWPTSRWLRGTTSTDVRPSRGRGAVRGQRSSTL